MKSVFGDRIHGSPYDRGSCDAYYGRGCKPHHWPDGTNHGNRVDEEKMNKDQIKEYYAGFDEEDDRKDWG